MGIELPEDRHWQKWITFTREAMSCLDDKGNWYHLPEAGGFYDQDQFFMIIWGQIRYELLSAKHDDGFMKTLRVHHGKSQY